MIRRGAGVALVPAVVLAGTLLSPAAPAAPAAPGASGELVPRLLVTMVVDRLVVEPGGIVGYAVRVDNVGDVDALHVRVTAHLPEHTQAASEHCPDGTIEPDGDICVHPEVPTSGEGDDRHQVVHSQSPLPAGEGFTLRFRVRVDDGTLPGTVLSNHAHAAAAGGEEFTTPTVETVVVGRVPDAFAGDGGIRFSGNVTTDSFDAAEGPYEETRRLTGGNLASNGGISLFGANVVHGDATPGPGHTVSLVGNSTVTGSVAAAPDEFTLPDVDASRYEASNANEGLCVGEGSCFDAAYDPATHTLRVGGSARIPPGAYHLCALDVTGRLFVEGPATLWIGSPEADVCTDSAGVVRFGSGSSVSVDTARPGDFHVRLEGSTTVEVRSQTGFTGAVDAPTGALVLAGGGEVFGGAIAGSIVSGAGGGSLHLDRSLHAMGGAAL